MRYVFIVQGEGRGHLTQALSLERLLRENGHEVAAVLVGKSKARRIPSFFIEKMPVPVETFESANFAASHSNRRVSIFNTITYNAFRLGTYIRGMRVVKARLRSVNPDVVVNFYDPAGAAAYRSSHIKAPMVCIGHQFLFLRKDFSFPLIGYEGHQALNFFSYMIARKSAKILALSFRRYDDIPGQNIKVVPPLLRDEVLSLRKDNGVDDSSLKDDGYIHGYMLNAGFAADVLQWHSEHPQTPLRFFWDKADEGPVKTVDSTLSFYYLDDKEFLRQMAGCHAYASTAGFESVCEAMYLGKPLLMVPTHIEQKCNAYDATSSPSCAPAIASDRFDLDALLDFADHKFVPDKDFPAWARSADEIFLRELTQF